MKWLREPLWVFLAIGVLLFWLDSRQAKDDLTITVTEADVGRLTAQWQAQMGRDPGEQELSGLIDQFVEEEVYYREALKYNLERNDTIIRRRLVQKLTFLTEDLATSVDPTDAELEAFFAERRDSYRVPQKYSFQHVYFSRDRREDASGDASAERARLKQPGDRPTGDPFMLQSNFAERSSREIASTFGVKFADALPDLKVDEWSQPVPSAYGSHLIYLHAIDESYIPEFATIKNRIVTDYGTNVRQQANDKLKTQLLEQYTVQRPAL